MFLTSRRVLAAALASAVIVACGKKNADQAGADSAAAAPAPAVVPFRVTSVDLGKAIGPDKKVTSPTTTFGVRDTVYAVVSTEGTSSGTNLVVHWKDQSGKIIAQDSTTIQPTGPAATEFHLTKRTPWQPGKYTVEVLADGQPAGSMDFEVAR
jgi:hypothetical protein